MMASSFLAPGLNTTLDDDLTAALQLKLPAPALGNGRSGPPLRTPWARAVRIFNDSLTPAEAKKFGFDSLPHASLKNFLHEVLAAQQEAQRKRSKTLDLIGSIAERITMYSGSMDVFSQANQELMFVWGSLKFLTQVAASEKHATDKLAQAIVDVLQIFGRCEQYSRLFSKHDRLLQAIGVLYVDVMNLLVRATRFYKKGNIKRFLSTSFTPFEVKFAPIVADIANHSAVVEAEAGLAQSEEQDAENNLQKKFRDDIYAKDTEHMSREVKLWLQPHDSAGDWRRIHQLQITDTCAWIESKEEYSDWENVAGSTILWIHGIPGSGKTVLASYIIQRLRRLESPLATPLIYFFCSGRDENRLASVHVLRSLIFQLQSQCPALESLVEKCFKASTSRIATSFEELWDLFVSMVKEQEVICIIDGLDECQTRDEDGCLNRSAFAHRLVNLVEQQSFDKHFKILLTSRNEPDLQIAFPSAIGFIHIISISSFDVSKDIQKFISSRIESSTQLGDLSDKLKSRVVETLQANAGGMFIWAQLMIRELETRESDEAIEDALKSVPLELFALYDRILDSLAQNFDRHEGIRDLGCFILCWTVYSARPLTLTELSEARCIVLGQSSLSCEKKPRSLSTFRRLIETSCAPLVEVQDDGLVQLVHHTTKEYLLHKSEQLFEICRPFSTFGVSPSSNHDIDSILSQVCGSYLGLDVFGTPLLGRHKRFQVITASDVRLTHSFLHYVSAYWLFYLSRSEYPAYSSAREFLSSPQALTWAESTILLQGGVDKLANILQYHPTFAAHTAAPHLDPDYTAVTNWFETLQRAILDWGGTLNQTPSEIHHLDILAAPYRQPAWNSRGLQRTTFLEFLPKPPPNFRAIESGDRFILRQPYLYIIPEQSSPISSWERYHWFSMQQHSVISRHDSMQVMRGNFYGRLVDTQLSETGRYFSLTSVGAADITVTVWRVTDDGFDIMPWAQNDGSIVTFSAEGKTRPFSHYLPHPVFLGPAFGDSSRYTTFSEHEDTIWTPAGAFDLATGKRVSLLECCSDSEISCATWSVHGQRLACIRAGKSLEIYENDGSLIATFHDTCIARAIIADFSESGRYVLLLDRNEWRFSIYDVHQQSLSFIPPLDFDSDENPLGLQLPEYVVNSVGHAQSFSPDERYVCILIRDGVNNRKYTSIPNQTSILVVWDLKSEIFCFKQFWSYEAACRPSYMQFDEFRVGILHVLMIPNQHLIAYGARQGQITDAYGTHGFVQLDMSDKRTFESSRELHHTWGDYGYTVCMNQYGSKIIDTLIYTRLGDDTGSLVDIRLWDLENVPPVVVSTITVPFIHDGWRDEDGGGGDWRALAKRSSMALVGPRLILYSEDYQSGKIVYTFDPQPVLDHIVSQLGNEELPGRKISEAKLDFIKGRTYGSFLSPDGSLLCFYISQFLIAIFDVQSHQLKWCHYWKGPRFGDVGIYRPIFHPTKPIVAWLEQHEDHYSQLFPNLKYLRIFISSVDHQNDIPIEVGGFYMFSSSNILFSHCGCFLYIGSIRKENWDSEQEIIRLSKIDIQSKTRTAYFAALNPITGPSYCKPRGIYAYNTMILKNDEIQFLITLEYKVMLAKIDFDGTIKWKLIASTPGPPRSSHAIAVGSRNLAENEQRMDIVLADQGTPRPTVINTWDETPDEWDEILKIEHDESLG